MSTAPPTPTVGDLAGRRALLSGGTRGTGAAVVTRLKAGGAYVTATARQTPEQLDADDFIAADISTAEGTSEVIEQIIGNGGIDIIVHLAGGGPAPSGGFAKLTPAWWIQTLELNLLGAVRLDRGLLPSMIAAGKGAIVHVTSIQRKMPTRWPRCCGVTARMTSPIGQHRWPMTS
jgi:NAD(P)-dependent dehydrogenase (short-subunit alcohol dehydrogenase family)